MSNEKNYLEIWCVYDSPSDYPEKFVARLFHNETSTDQVRVSSSLGALRSQFASEGLFRLERFADDDPVIVETWL